MTASPILVLAAGQRCGSTLVQRLLSSHPDVLIWGEHAGQLRQILAAGTRLRLWSEEDGRIARDGYAARGHQSFMANLTPDPQTVDDSVRRFIEDLFRRPASAMGRSIWGLKEVRYGLPEAEEIRRLFPKACTVHIVRDPRDVLRSLDVWERGNGAWRRRETESALRDWLRVAYSFLHADEAQGSSVLRVRYEDLVSDQGIWFRRIAEHCDLDPKCLDVSVFARRIHTDGPAGERLRVIRDWADLPESTRELVNSDEFRCVASACGYDL